MVAVTYANAVYPLKAGESVLDALLRGGADVRHSCRKGSCRSCLLQLDRDHAGDGAGHGAGDGVCDDATRNLEAELVASGHFLPCLCHPTHDLAVNPPDRRQRFIQANVEQIEALAPDVTRVLLEPWETFTWRPGQYLNLRNGDGLTRSYSIASRQTDDYFVELHVRTVDGGAMSPWIAHGLAAGDTVDIQGPFGDAIYRDAWRNRDLLLIGGGTGIAPLLGVARDALALGHRGGITIWHGAHAHQDLYLDAHLAALDARHDRVHYQPVTATGDAPGLVGTPLDHAFGGVDREHPPVLFLAGPPAWVFEGRYRAVEAGIRRDETHCDPFLSSQPYMPDDDARMARLPAEPAIWRALDEGPGLIAILQRFYDEVYADDRLSPYFLGIPRERVIAKQYEFLADVFTGRRHYMGLRPFNAHHLMIVDDALFDYREALFERVVLGSGFPADLWPRWAAIQELFRADIVKSTPRGMVIDSVERPEQGSSAEVMTVATVCDGCQAAIEVGERARLHHASGKVFCTRCDARDAGEGGEGGEPRVPNTSEAQ